MLAAAQPGGRIGEIGSGAGVGAAWLASGLGGGAKLDTAETDPALARAAEIQFADRADVQVVASDCRHEFVSHGPFDLLFADGGNCTGPDAAAALANLVSLGGLVVVDDLTPEKLWPPSWRGKPDPKRELAFRSGHFNSVEVLVRPEVAVLHLTPTAMSK